MVVSPLNALIADQRESCQRLKLKAVKMERELFDNDDTLKELKNAEVLYRSPETLENIRSKKFFLRMDNRLIGIVVEKSHCVVSELVGLIAQPINLGLSMFVRMKGFSFVTCNKHYV